MIRLVRALAALAAILVAAPLVAHESLPIVVRVEQVGADTFALRTRVPGNVPADRAPRASLASRCAAENAGRGAVVYRCPPGTPRPDAVLLGWRGTPAPSQILVRATFADGATHNLVAVPGSTRIDLPRTRAPAEVLPAYFRIGVEHIAGGVDHLLFLACLVLLAGSFGRILRTVTGFTLGHALTISLAALGHVSFDARGVETLIALSIVFLAAELARGNRDDLVWRHPVIVAAAFGMLHGLGFASALADVGLPPGQITRALIGFNLGVEAGQIIFVAAVAGLVAAVRRYASPRPAGAMSVARPAAIWLVGSVAGFWFVDRTVAALLA